MKMLLTLAGAAVVLTAAPADARNPRHHHRTAMVCAKYRHHHCVAYRTASMRHVARWRTGYVFGPSYSYTAYDALPQPYVTRYHLSPDYRYVYTNGYIYQVDPKTYAIDRVIYALTH